MPSYVLNFSLLQQINQTLPSGYETIGSNKCYNNYYKFHFEMVFCISTTFSLKFSSFNTFYYKFYFCKYGRLGVICQTPTAIL